MTTPRSDRTAADAAVGDAMRSRLWSTADLSAVRAEARGLLERTGIAPAVVVDVLLALSELLTNALTAATPGTPVDVVVSVGPDPSESRFCGRRRRIDVSVTNQGEPIPGRLIVSPLTSTSASSPSGRGLPLAARVGEVVVEGIVGGTRASLRRSVVPTGTQVRASR